MSQKILYSDSFISKKLVYVPDILNSDLKLLTHNQFNDKFALQWDEINFWQNNISTVTGIEKINWFLNHKNIQKKPEPTLYHKVN